MDYGCMYYFHSYAILIKVKLPFENREGELKEAKILMQIFN